MKYLNIIFYVGSIEHVFFCWRSQAHNANEDTQTTTMLDDGGWQITCWDACAPVSYACVQLAANTELHMVLFVFIVSATAPAALRRS